MGRGTNKLSDRTVRSLKAPGRYGDGLGLWLQIGEAGTKSWLFRYMLDGKARMMGIGRYGDRDVSLDEAREKAGECRRLLREGKDPIEERDAKKSLDRLARAKTLTFDECADSYIESMRSGWKNEKHASQWENTLRTYASPIIGKLPVASIDDGLVLKVIEPIWTTKPETASRLRGRIESILGWATVRKYRQGDNPARWKDHLDTQLPARGKVAKVVHHSALPHAEIGGFIASLRNQAGIAALALEFTILTVARTGEVIGATWQEFDMQARVWTIPAGRMKAEKEHCVPLSARAIAVLEEMLPLKTEDGGAVFPGRGNGPLSNMSLLAVLKRMGRAGLTVHGFRSTFRDWAGETTAYPREVIEHALAHQLKDKAEAAYARGTLFNKRRRLMEDWAKYCAAVKKAEGETVVPIGKGRTA